MTLQGPPEPTSPLTGPAIVPAFEKELDHLVTLAKRGHQPPSRFFNPSDQWLIGQMQILQDLPLAEREQLLVEAKEVSQEAEAANAAGKAAVRAWPGLVVRLDTGGYGFFSQLGVARRPDLT